MKPDEFISTIAPYACRSMADTGIPASVIIAQAALESGWGAHAPGMNLFGIKADQAWTGPVTTKTTSEVVNGKTMKIVAKFRAYPDWLGSIEDHSQFFLRNPRYAHALTCCDGELFAQAIAQVGYATDPNYAAKLIAVIRSHDLAAFDKETA
jgi:flagellar protein FlgJ